MSKDEGSKTKDKAKLYIVEKRFTNSMHARENDTTVV